MSTNDSVIAAANGETEPGTLSQAAVTEAMIHAALAKLDPANDDDWTTTGKPAMEAVNAHLPTPITRARLDEVAPDFSRPEQPSEDGDAGSEGDAGGAGAVDGGEGSRTGLSGDKVQYGEGHELGGDGAQSGVSQPQPPVDNDHVADGASQFSDAEVKANAGERPQSRDGIEYALDALKELQDDLAYLRKTFGWPTKDA